MARSRTIKPSFFTNEELAELPRDVRLFFVGIWGICDREGRLENRPKRIKRDVFPYDADVTEQMIECWLAMLADHPSRFVHMYEVDGCKYIQVKNFKKHQDIHPRETQSVIPGPPKAGLGLPSTEQDGNKAAPRLEVIPLPSCTSLPSASLSSQVLEASVSDPERARVERLPQSKTAYDWLEFFKVRHREKTGRFYGQGTADATALANFADLLASLPPDQRAADWDARERIVAEFLARTDSKTVQDGWPFCFFTTNFRGLAMPPDKRPAPEQPQRPVQRQAVYPKLPRAAS